MCTQNPCRQAAYGSASIVLEKSELAGHANRHSAVIFRNVDWQDNRRKRNLCSFFIRDVGRLHQIAVDSIKRRRSPEPVSI